MFLFLFVFYKFFKLVNVEVSYTTVPEVYQHF